MSYVVWHPHCTTFLNAPPISPKPDKKSKSWLSYVDYVNGANIAGFIKVADAMLAQGVV